MATQAAPPAARNTRLGAGSRTVVRLLAPFLVFALGVAAIVTVRSVMLNRQAADRAATVAAAAAAPFPTSANIEQTWGIRFTTVRLVVDGGDVEIRYSAVDTSKDGRLHSGNVGDLPYLIAEDTKMEVRSSSLMLNLHYTHAGEDIVGGTYSVIYGNSNGAVHPGGLVTIVLPDGLKLEHVPVS